jgi:hypothetical protein
MGTESVGICKPGTKTCNAEGTAYSDCTGDVKPGMEDCTKPEDEDCSGFACSQPLWAKDFPGLDVQTVQSIAIDSAGNIIVAGLLFGSASFGGNTLIAAGGADVFVAKLAPDGTHLWSHRFGDGSPQFVKSIAVDGAGNVLLAGQFKGTIDFGGGPLLSKDYDVFVAKFDASGTYAWSSRFGDIDDQGAADVAVDPSGNVILVGAFSGSINLGGSTFTSAGSSDIFVAKLNAVDGSHVWSKQFGDASNQSASTVAVDSSGSVIFGGTMSGSFSFGDLPLTGNNDLYAVKLDASGGHSWSKKFGGGFSGLDLALDMAGSVVLTGRFKAGSLNFGGADVVNNGTQPDVFLAKLSPTGEHAWSKNLGILSPTSSFGQSQVAVDGDGNVLLASLFHGTVDFGGVVLTSVGVQLNVALTKYDSGGTHAWSKRFGDGTLSSGLLSLAVAADAISGAVLLGSANQGTIDFGTGPLTTAGDFDAVLAKFAP